MDTNKRLLSAVDAAGEEETEERLKKRRLRSASSSSEEEEEGSMYYQFSEQMEVLLPSCWLSWSKDWTYLLKFIDACSIIDPEPRFEFASLCLWFLSTAPETYQDGAREAHIQTLMPLGHKEALSSSLEHVLDSKHEYVIQQACCAIAFLCWYSKCNYFGDAVVNKLFDLVEKNSHRSPYLAHARHVICSIACFDKSVKAKIMIKAKADPLYKWPFLYGVEEEAEHACMIAACIFRPEIDKFLMVMIDMGCVWWMRQDTIEGVLIPHILDAMRVALEADDIPVMLAAAYAISSAAYGATPEQIDQLFDMGCLAILCISLLCESPPLTSHSLYGINHILQAGQLAGHRKYVDWIENDKVSPGWEAFRGVKDKFLCLPCFLWEASASIQFRAYLMASLYGGCQWIDTILFGIYENDD